MLKKALFIAQKDCLIRLYDRAGFAFLIITPLMITLIMGAVFGDGDSETANFRVPIAVLNYDEGVETATLGQSIITDEASRLNKEALLKVVQTQIDKLLKGEESGLTAAQLEEDSLNFGQVITDLFLSEDFADILEARLVDDEAAARAAIESGQPYCCLVIIPDNFSQAILLNDKAEVIIYSDPAQAVNRQIIESIVNQVTSQFAASNIMFNLTFQNTLSGPNKGVGVDVADIITDLSRTFTPDEVGQNGLSLVEVNTIDRAGEAVAFNPLSYFAPSLAIMFLAFGAAAGAQSIREEDVTGTLGRLNASPVASSVILFGKLLGTFATSGLQFAILLILSVLLFGLRWGDPLAVVVMAVLMTITFTCLGLVMAVIAKDMSQANVISNAVILVFSLIGGNLTPASDFPAWLETIAKITPNYWSVQAFIKLGLSQTLADLGPEILALSLISLLLFGVGTFLYQRRLAV